MDFNNMSLDDLLKVSSDGGNTMTGKLFDIADVDVTLTKELQEEQSESIEDIRKKAMSKLEEYESCEKQISTLDGEMTLLSQEFDALIASIKLEHKDLIDKINSKAEEIEAKRAEQEQIKEDLLPLQRTVFMQCPDDKTLKFNKIQSTYVAPTEKNQFDLKLFREEQPKFWEEHLDILGTYAKITSVSDYIKITISKK